MTKNTKLFFAAHDPGGFNALWPVIKKLSEQANLTITTFLAKHSIGIAKQQKIPYVDANHLTLTKLSKLLNQKKPDLIVVATSWGPSIEKKFTKIAQDKKIKTVAIVDFWCNYRLRFSENNGDNLAYLPDYILVTDQIMKKEMTAQGFSAKQLIVTGNPFFDTFKQFKTTNSKSKITSFFSQPFTEILATDDPQYASYNEILILTDIISALETSKIKTEILIKLHPRAKKTNKFNRVIKKSKLNISIEKKLSVEKMIEKSRVIIGINSMVLFEAAMMGKPVISYQPNLTGADTLISNRLGLSWGVYKKKHLAEILQQAWQDKLTSKNQRAIKKYCQNNSTKKVITFLKTVLTV